MPIISIGFLWDARQKNQKATSWNPKNKNDILIIEHASSERFFFENDNQDSNTLFVAVKCGELTLKKIFLQKGV